MRFAIIPITLADRPRATALSRHWMEQACASVSRYIQHQSGGQAAAEFSLLDWLPLQQTFQQWREQHPFVRDTVYQQVHPAQAAALSDADHVLYVLDDGLTQGGHTDVGQRTSILAARDLSPTLIAHAVAHAFGAHDTHIDTAAGPALHGARFCVMGHAADRHAFHDPALAVPGEESNRHAATGPGMSVPALLVTGWLSLQRHGAQVCGIPGDLPAAPLTLRALDGVPPQDSGPPVCCYIDDGARYLVEYRLRSARWDTALPDADHGWLIVHRTPHDAPLQSLQVTAAPATPGTILSLGGAQHRTLHGTSPLQLIILAADAKAARIEFQFSRRPTGVPHMQASSGLQHAQDYHLFSPRTGWQSLPAATDLATVWQGAADLALLRDALRTLPERYAAGFASAFEQQRIALQKSVIAIDQRDVSVADQLLTHLRQLRAQLDDPTRDRLRGELAQLEALARAAG
jgi:hypothetical protein